jgi:hypothetical protein
LGSRGYQALTWYDSKPQRLCITNLAQLAGNMRSI